MRHIATTTFLLIFAISSFAQNDSIKNQILNYQNNESEIISKARRMLIDRLEANDYEKVNEIKDYLRQEVENQNYLALYTPEYWFILYWTQEFDELLKSIENTGYQIDAKETSSINKQIRPLGDDLYEKLKDKSGKEKHLLDIIIENAPLTLEERDFLQLHLNYCLFGSKYHKINQDTLNNLSDKFLLKYPSSSYAPFIKKVIRYKEKVSEFGWGYDISLGYGGFEGGIAKSFSEYFVLGMSLDFTYKNVVLNLAFSIGSSKLKKDIEYESVIWEKEKKGDVILPQASLGYTILGNKRINFTPFVGVSSFYISPQWEDMQNYTLLEDVELNSGASWNAGISLNFYSKMFKTPSYLRRMRQVQGVLKLKYTYFHSGFKKEYYGLDGAMHQVAIAFGGFSRKVRRSF